MMDEVSQQDTQTLLKRMILQSSSQTKLSMRICQDAVLPPAGGATADE